MLSAKSINHKTKAELNALNVFVEFIPNIAEFYVLLTVHLGSVLVNNQLDLQFFFRIYLFQFSTCFEHLCAHHQENHLY